MRSEDMSKCTVDSCEGWWGYGGGGEMREKYLTQNENGQRTDKEWTKVTKVLQVGSAESPNSSLFVFVRCFPFRFGNSLPHNLCSLFSKSCAICVLSS